MSKLRTSSKITNANTSKECEKQWKKAGRTEHISEENASSGLATQYRVQALAHKVGML